MEVTLGAVCVGEKTILLCFHFTLALSWLQTHHPSSLPIHPASSGPKDQRTKSEQWLRPCRHHLQVRVNVHQAIREGEEGVRLGTKFHGSIHTKQTEATLWTQETGVGQFTFSPKSFSHLSIERNRSPKLRLEL